MLSIIMWTYISYMKIITEMQIHREYFTIIRTIGSKLKASIR